MIFVCLFCRDVQPQETVPRDNFGNPFCFGCGREMLPYYTASESKVPTPDEMEEIYRRKNKTEEGGTDDVRRIISPDCIGDTAQRNKDQ